MLLASLEGCIHLLQYRSDFLLVEVGYLYFMLGKAGESSLGSLMELLKVVGLGALSHPSSLMVSLLDRKAAHHQSGRTRRCLLLGSGQLL